MTESLRIWERPLHVDADGAFEIPLRFRVVPAQWPNIDLVAAEGTMSDVHAVAYEAVMRFDPGDEGELSVDVGGFRFATRGRTLVVEGEVVALPEFGDVRVSLRFEGDAGQLVVDDGAPIALAARHPETTTLATAVTTNIEGFRIGSLTPPVGAGHVRGGLVVRDATIYGLRESSSSLYRVAEADHDAGELFYESQHFAVYDGSVTGADAAALVPDARTIVSHLRAVEEFVWRDNHLGDMTRVVDRAELWRSTVEPGRFPILTTAFRTVDAAFELALETFQRNASEEFALPGEVGMWSAGYFQGPGQGFGVWKRDTSHIALRSGSLLDPEVARRSLVHIVNSGFDNGSDGDALPAVAIWDYYLLTGDESLIHETWPRLAEVGAALDVRYDDERALVVAAQSTSNDCFDEPEVDGFALSVQVYSMQSYAALGRMAELVGGGGSRAARWRDRAEGMRRSIHLQYWSDARGYFTSGPMGSESFERGYWETSGAEAALWGFLGDDAHTESVLRSAREVAMSEYGVVLFPYKEPINHFCGSVWYGWQAGIARAAARVGDAELVHQLIGQQVRSVVRNKTFYEVTDAGTGDSWRWPGQLWHAAGFASLVLLGVFGVSYDEDGLRFTPAVAPQFDGARLSRLRYRGAVLDVEVRGHGTRCVVTLDGHPVDRIAPDLTGRHTVVLAMQ